MVGGMCDSSCSLLLRLKFKQKENKESPGIYNLLWLCVVVTRASSTFSRTDRQVSNLIKL
jgi:hypothetical protein